MREIKFRAWNKVKKEMVTDAINNCVDSFDLVLKHPQIYGVMQYTGLKDKNGVEIYEGDILLARYAGLDDSYSEVIFKDGAFWNKEKDCKYPDLLVDVIRDSVIIGNIYECIYKSTDCCPHFSSCIDEDFCNNECNINPANGVMGE